MRYQYATECRQRRLEPKSHGTTPAVAVREGATPWRRQAAECKRQPPPPLPPARSFARPCSSPCSPRVPFIAVRTLHRAAMNEESMAHNLHCSLLTICSGYIESTGQPQFTMMARWCRQVLGQREHRGSRTQDKKCQVWCELQSSLRGSVGTSTKQFQTI